MRIVDYTSIASRNLRGQPVRSLLTIFALVISTVILVLMAAISIGGRQAITQQFGSDASLQAISVTPNQSSGTLSPFGSVQKVDTTASKLTDETVALLAKQTHVQSATPRAHIWEFNNFTLKGNNTHFVAQAEGITSDSGLPIKAGALFTSNDQRNVVVVGSGYAQSLGYGNNPEKLIGQSLQIESQKGYRGFDAAIPGASATRAQNEAFDQSTTTLTATIIGVTNSGPDQNSIFIPLGWAHEIRTSRYLEAAGLKTVDAIATDGYATIQVKVDATNNVKSVATSIENLGYGQFSTLSQIERLQQFSTTMLVILGAIALIAVVAAALGVVNTMLMSVSEQRYMIGVWRASGARKNFIVKVFLIEAGLLGFIGGIIGVIVGFVTSGFINQYVNMILKQQGLTIVDIAVIPIWLMAGTVLLTTAFGILAGLYPAYRAARQDPSKVLSSGQ
ncbi:MAG TPA: ABC transporter permease [Candidatus Microsaccharimonas sp.]|jgi:putative ABC transport system permease protein